MDLCAFYFLFFKDFLIQMDQEAMGVLTIPIFWKMFFYFPMDMQTFAFVHCILSTHQHLRSSCTMLHNSSRSLIWYNMSQHQYIHKCELPHPLISYNSMEDQIFIPWASRKKTSSLFWNIMISQMMKTQKLKFWGVLVAEVNFKILQSKAVESGWKNN
jgi:hypothetical protein